MTGASRLLFDPLCRSAEPERSGEAMAEYLSLFQVPGAFIGAAILTQAVCNGWAKVIRAKRGDPEPIPGLHVSVFEAGSETAGNASPAR